MKFKGLVRYIKTTCLLLIIAISSSSVWSRELPGQSQESYGIPTGAEISDVELAPVEVDGHVLFYVRGVSVYPAAVRAEAIKQRIISVASDSTLTNIKGDVRKTDETYDLTIEGKHILTILQADADLEGVDIQTLAGVTIVRLEGAVKQWRAEREIDYLRWAAAKVAGYFFMLILFFWGVKKLFSFLNGVVETGIEKNASTKAKSLVSDEEYRKFYESIFALLSALEKLTLGVAILGLFKLCLDQFPWTRAYSLSASIIIGDPLRELWAGLIGFLPNLIFLVILFFLVRFILGVIKAFFQRLQLGVKTLRSFDPELAKPTYSLIRVAVIAMSLVVAYPYIPGSGSDAFKGVSIFFGLLLSLGSSSFIGNLVAGYSLIYRRAYQVGDFIKVGETTGTVEEMRALSTRIRTPKNEEANFPNSFLLNSEILNYSKLQKSHGLIFHAETSIGYDTPWRQVEAMLLEAVAKTEGFKTQPPPYVLQKGLGDFSVIYQVNAFLSTFTSLERINSQLLANIQDVFNQYGVQIMSPAYEADPENPKVVPSENWYLSPASPPD